MSARKEILKQVTLYSAASQLTQIITLVAAVLSRRFLGPTQMGIWATLQILVDYSKYSTFGTMHGVARKIPYYMGKGERSSAEKIKDVVFSVILTNSLLVAAGLWIFAVTTRGRFRPEMTYGLFFVAAIIVFQRMSDFLLGLLRCYKEFTLASKQMICSAIVNAFLVAVFTKYFKIYGFVWAVGLSLVFNIVFIHLHHNFNFKFKFDRKVMIDLAGFGFPLMMIGILMTVLRSIDKISIVKMLGFQALGHYSVALMVASYIMNLTNSIAIVLIPHFQEKFSENDNPKDLAVYLTKSAHAYALVIPAMIGGAWALGPFFVSRLLPQYVPGIPAMEILSMGMFYLTLFQPYQDFLITIKKHLLLFPVMAFTFAVALGLNFFAVCHGYGITGISLATSFAFFLSFSLTFFVSARYIYDSRTAVKEYILLMGYSLYLLAVFLAAEALLPHDTASFPGLFLRLAVFGTAYFPFLVILNRHFSFVEIILKKLGGRAAVQKTNAF